jgi:hypothetical protein
MINQCSRIKAVAPPLSHNAVAKRSGKLPRSAAICWLMTVLEPVTQSLKRVALQGTKAYGVHVRPLSAPAREGRSSRRDRAVCCRR